MVGGHTNMIGSTKRPFQSKLLSNCIFRKDE